MGERGARGRKQLRTNRLSNHQAQGRANQPHHTAHWRPPPTQPWRLAATPKWLPLLAGAAGRLGRFRALSPVADLIGGAGSVHGTNSQHDFQHQGRAHVCGRFPSLAPAPARCSVPARLPPGPTCGPFHIGGSCGAPTGAPNTAAARRSRRRRPPPRRRPSHRDHHHGALALDTSLHTRLAGSRVPGRLMDDLVRRRRPPVSVWVCEPATTNTFIPLPHHTWHTRPIPCHARDAFRQQLEARTRGPPRARMPGWIAWSKNRRTLTGTAAGCYIDAWRLSWG